MTEDELRKAYQDLLDSVDITRFPGCREAHEALSSVMFPKIDMEKAIGAVSLSLLVEPEVTAKLFFIGTYVACQRAVEIREQVRNN